MLKTVRALAVCAVPLALLVLGLSMARAVEPLSTPGQEYDPVCCKLPPPELPGCKAECIKECLEQREKAKRDGKVCMPGSRITTFQCMGGSAFSAGGFYRCETACKADGSGWDKPSCLRVDAMGETTQRYCNFNAGCPFGQGKPVMVTTSCDAVAGGSVTRQISVGACGEGGCKRDLRVVCRPGKPCPDARCVPGDSRPECDYCEPGSTRDCNGQTQVCGGSGIFPPCAECTDGEQRTCRNGRVVSCVNGQFPPCTSCVPGDRVYCPCDGKWKECTPDGEFEACSGVCAPGQVIYCPDGRQRVCNAQCQVEPCGECPPNGCPPPPCTDQCCLGQPQCVERPGYWVCEWNGTEVVRIPTPCPEVVREPWPRALVGVPVELRLVDSCQPRTTSNTVAVDPPLCDNSFYIIGYRGTVAFQCTAARLADARWTMDERPFNIGQTSDNIMTPYVGDGRPNNNMSLRYPRMTDDIMRETEGSSVIRNVRTGRVVRHIYETPSLDKPINGPGWPNVSQREPAYQVNVRTSWELVGTFQYQRLITYIKCYDSGGNEMACDWCFDPRNGNRLDCNKCYNSDFMPGECEWEGYEPPPGPAYSRTFTETPWFAGPVVRVPVTVEGALVRDDPQRRNICGVIPIPVQQVQTVLRP